METKRKYIPKYTIQELVDEEREGIKYRNKINSFLKSIESKEAKKCLWEIIAPKISYYLNKKKYEEVVSEIKKREQKERVEIYYAKLEPLGA